MSAEPVSAAGQHATVMADLVADLMAAEGVPQRFWPALVVHPVSPPVDSQRG